MDRYLDAWRLTPDGMPFRTPSSWLRPVRSNGVAAMLKMPFDDEERVAIPVLAWFEGDGAARVLRWDKEAQLIERLADDVSLVAMAEGGQDSAATRIICGVIARLHGPRSTPPPDCLIPLRRRFRDLEKMASVASEGRVLYRAAWVEAQELMATASAEVVLHGDVHHGNVLHDPQRGWVAIDPKGLIGPRGYDYANILHNTISALPLAPGRLRGQAEIIVGEANLPLREVLGWAFAHAALSAAWSTHTGESADLALAIAEIARAELKAAPGKRFC